MRVIDHIAQHAQTRSERLAVHDLTAGRRWGYGALDRAVGQWAAMLRRDFGLVEGTADNPQPSAALTKFLAAMLGKTFAPGDNNLGDEERRQIQIVKLVEALQDELSQRSKEAISLLDGFSEQLGRKERETLRTSMTEEKWQALVDDAQRQRNENIAIKWGTTTADAVAKQFGLGPSGAGTARKVIEDAAAKSIVSGDLTALNKITDALRAMNNFKGPGITLVPESVLDYSKEIAGIQSLYSILLKKEREAREPKKVPGSEFGPEEQWLKESMKEGVYGYYQVPLPGEEKLKTRRPWGIGEFVANWLGVPMPERR